jgi:diguanylate cyclase (GGDEF)-like protein
MLDLDNFKQINDTYGHKTGDHALQTVVRLLKSCILDRDCIARYGGDEFCIILNASNNIMLEGVILKIKKSFKEYNDSNSSNIKLGLSMGYSIYDINSNTSAEEFINKIDKLMYINKNADKNLKQTC